MESKDLELTNRLNAIILSSTILSEQIQFHTFQDFLVYLQDKINNAKNSYFDYLILAAFFSHQFNSEKQGNEFLNEASKEESINERDLELINFLRAMLFRFEAVNHVNIYKDYSTAVTYYFKSLNIYLELKLNSGVLLCLESIKDLSDWFNPGVQKNILVGLVETALAIERQCGEEAFILIKDICNICISRITAHENITERGHLFIFTQIVKGHLFSHALEQSVTELFYIMEDWEKLSEKSPKFSTKDLLSGKLSDAIENVPYMRFDNYNSISNKKEMSKKEFDTFINSIIHRYTGLATKESFFPKNKVIHSVKDIQESINAETTLIYIYLGNSYNNKNTTYSFFISKSHFGLEVCIQDVGFDEIISDTIKQLQTNPGRSFLFGKKREASNDCQVCLHDISKLLWDDSIENVFSKHNISDGSHICFVPHGSLHYFPFHLLSYSNQPLSSTFKISYSPNLHLTTIKRHKSAFPRTDSIFAVGVDFVNSSLFTSIPEVISEVVSIANTYDVSPVINEDATFENVILGLRSYKYIHIATHAEMDNECPNFHRLYLHSVNEEITCLFAYQLMSLDMRGTDLISLSACETALCRFDNADNLRGLPAIFFLTGVSSIIATLWEVESKTSEFFFKTFYKLLKDGKTRIDSFSEAQEITRAKYSEYRDWGAFYFMGKYDEKDYSDDFYTIPGIPYLQFGGGNPFE